MSTRIRNSILKYPGGKARELPKLLPLFPDNIDTFIDPFVGGGSVWLGSNSKNNLINDYSCDLINLYNNIDHNRKDLTNIISKFNLDLSTIEFDKTVNDDLSIIDNVNDILPIINEFAKNIHLAFYNVNDYFQEEFPKYTKRKIKYLDKHGFISNEDTLDLLQTALNGAYYNSIRQMYNMEYEPTAKRAAIYLYIREFCYSSMFRFSKTGKFNVPYGGKSYNKKRMNSFIEFYNDKHLINKLYNSEIFNLDFEDFLDHINISEKDFIFLDPPYDTDFSTYDNNTFDKQEQIRLAQTIKKQKSKWMLVIKDSDLIRELYPSDKYKYIDYKNRYAVNFKNRNIQSVKHLVITNY